jgi:hypothetical protein
MPISEPLLRVAKERAIAENLGAVAFVQADAQTYAFEAGRFHAVMSRFGVMFFDGSRGSVRQYQARDTIRGKACIRGVAEPCGKSLHDDGCTRRRAVVTEPVDSRCWCTWSVCVCRGRPRTTNSECERLEKY